MIDLRKYGFKIEARAPSIERSDLHYALEFAKFAQKKIPNSSVARSSDGSDSVELKAPNGLVTNTRYAGGYILWFAKNGQGFNFIASCRFTDYNAIATLACFCNSVVDALKHGIKVYGQSPKIESTMTNVVELRIGQLMILIQEYGSSNSHLRVVMEMDTELLSSSTYDYIDAPYKDTLLELLQSDIVKARLVNVLKSHVRRLNNSKLSAVSDHQFKSLDDEAKECNNLINDIEK
jgi:hypothetical protein